MKYNSNLIKSQCIEAQLALCPPIKCQVWMRSFCLWNLHAGIDSHENSFSKQQMPKMEEICRRIFHRIWWHKVWKAHQDSGTLWSSIRVGQKLIKEQVAVGKAGKILVVMTARYLRRSSWVSAWKAVHAILISGMSARLCIYWNSYCLLMTQMSSGKGGGRGGNIRT